ncbi:MAG: NAD-dependent epimerase/dehydratase family protein [Planctomycetota bacterium]|nr:NAD-dependent epimerase/dehydratase family protein [Planctomycetota bacterium]
MSTAFVSGPTGCIGAATVEYLLQNDVERVVGFCRTRDLSRIRSRFHDRLELIEGDIRDRQAVIDAVARAQPQLIIHLAAFQTPDCIANPLLGMDVNVGGTANLFVAARQLGDQLQRFVFASSSAVYGPRDLYPGPVVKTSMPYQPSNIYGYWKVAGEGMARAFHMESGIPTVSVRLSTTYGPGRDQGLTSAPTTALKNAAIGKPFKIPYRGREHYHFVSDVGAGFGQAALESLDEYATINLRGTSLDEGEFIRLIEEAASDLGFDHEIDIGYADGAPVMPFVCDLDDELTLERFPNMPLTPLKEGITISLRQFSQ